LECFHLEPFQKIGVLPSATHIWAVAHDTDSITLCRSIVWLARHFGNLNLAAAADAPGAAAVVVITGSPTAGRSPGPWLAVLADAGARSRPPRVSVTIPRVRAR
jgi:hypothetical protein